MMAAGLILIAPNAGSTAERSPNSAPLQVTQDDRYRWGEHMVAVNPKNPQNLVYISVGGGFTNDCQAHSTDCKIVMTDFGLGRPVPQARGLFDNPRFNALGLYTSFDGGRTWTRRAVPVSPRAHPDLTGVGDPYVTAAPDGAFYISFDDMNWGQPQKPLPDAGVAVSRSVDGGRTWSTPVLTGTPVDGPKIAADPNTGVIYEASSTVLGPHASGDPKAPAGTVVDRWLVSSRDGVHWSQPHGMGSGDAVSMAPAHGLLAAAFRTTGTRSLFATPNNDLCGRATAPCTIFETTADAGASWTRHVVPVPNDYADRPGQPMIAADPAHKGHYALAIPLPEEGGYRVYQTSDAGQSWTGPATVTDDAGKRHFHGAMAYSPAGVLGLMWLTRQPAPGQVVTSQTEPGPGPATPYSVWAAVSRDGGGTFSKALKVSRADSPAPQSAPFAAAGDDYASLALWGDHVYVGWADWSPRERAGYFRALTLEQFQPPR